MRLIYVMTMLVTVSLAGTACESKPDPAKPGPAPVEAGNDPAPAADEKVAAGDEAPAADEKVAAGDEAPAADEKVAAGDEAPAADEKVAAGDEAPAADEKVAAGDEAPAADEKVAAGVDTAAVAAAPAKATLGQPAPDFTLTDTDGGTFKLSDHRGKTVVLEWFNPDCPFVKYAYEAGGPLRGKAKGLASDHLVWVTINSGAPGKQGHGVERNKKAVADYDMAGPVLVDEDGAVGQMYEARTTPHLYVVDADGKLVYRGGLDNAPLGNAPEGETVRSYIDEALEDIGKGTAVRTPDTKPYGCSVKYSM